VQTDVLLSDTPSSLTAISAAANERQALVVDVPLPELVCRKYIGLMIEEDITELRAAVKTLEHPGLAVRLAEIAGKPIELVGKALPETVSKAVTAATTKALNAALVMTFRTMQNEPKAASGLLHKALAATSGAVGGSFGLAALPIELPVSTLIMLRSIGDIARSAGEDLRSPETALACLQVFALGGLKGEADAANSGYFAVRGLLAKSVGEAARFIAERGGVAEGAPVLVRLIAQIASRFGVVVTQKLVAQAVPLIGALGGAAVNYAFIDHFQEVARAHFVVRRLERRYGKDAVRAAYERLSGETLAA
jgi:EcsC protein family